MKFPTSILLAGTLMLAACDFLDVEPKSDVTSENFYRTATDAEAALVGCYDGLQGSRYDRETIQVGGIMADELRAVTGGNFTAHEAFNPAASQGNISDIWRDSYQAVVRCLDVLENVPNINDPALDKDRVLGEARFIRALLYFHLTRYFGSIPLVLQATKSPNQDFQLPRSEQSAVFQVIIDDLLEAERLLPVTNGGRVRATKGAARAMLARVYLYRNLPGDREKALAECQQVLADNQYLLVPGASYASMFAVAGRNTTETIFEISHAPNAVQENASFMLDDEFEPGARFRIVPEQKIITAFAANPADVRRNAALGVYNNITYVKKYEAAPPPRNLNPRVQNTNVIVIRLADVVLMQAECLNELGRVGEAVPLLNRIRTRAGLANTTATTQPALRLAIEDERYLEFAFEGLRWHDLVRTNRAQAVIPTLTNATRILWPVPSREIDLNPNLLPQNPGY